MNISPEDGMNKVCKFLYRYQQTAKKYHHEKNIIVGDIHGDIFQLFLPLIDSGIITIEYDVPELKYNDKEYPECDLYIPIYRVNKSDTNVYYLGDLTEEGMFSREVVYCLNDISKKYENIFICIGNHDCHWLSLCSTKDLRLNLFNDNNSAFETFIKDTIYSPNITIVGNKILYKNNINDEFMKSYYKPLLDSYYEMFVSRRMNIAYCINDSVISHTIIIDKSIDELIRNISRNPNELKRNEYIIDRKNYKIDLDMKAIGFPKSFWLKHKESLFDQNLLNKSSDILKNYKKYKTNEVIDAINDYFYFSSREYIHSNRLTYNRTENSIFKNNIIGHTIPRQFISDEGFSINPIGCELYSERKQHEKPINGIYYFDLKSSAGLDLENVSRPCYFVTDDFKSFTIHDKYGIRLLRSIENKIEILIYKGLIKANGLSILK